MEKNNTKIILNIEPLSFTTHLAKTFLRIVGFMIITGFISFMITSNESNQFSLLMIYVCITFVLFGLNVVSGFRKSFTYIYRIRTGEEIITIDYHRLFSKQVEIVHVKDLDLKLENCGSKNLCLVINSTSGEGGFCIEQTMISEWKKKRISKIYEALKRLVPTEVN